MKTTSKKYIVLSLIFVAICLPITALILFMASRNTPIDQDTIIIPPSFPASYPNGIDVDIDTNPSNITYKYALISKDDFVLLRNDSQELYINLEKKNWKGIRFSPNGNLVAVLGQTQKDIFDLFIYNIKDKKWTQATKFSQANSGLDNFVWENDSLIYFVQGTSEDRWIHSYNYISGEIIKIEKVFGEIISSNKKAVNIVVNDVDKFKVYDKELNLLDEVDKVQEIEGVDYVFTGIYADYGEKFYLTNSTQYYEYNITNFEDKISPTQFEEIPLCQNAESSIYTLAQTTESIKINNLNIDFNSSTLILESELSLNFDQGKLVNKTLCFADKIYFFIDNSVYNIDNNKFSVVKVFENSTDFDIL